MPLSPLHSVVHAATPSNLGLWLPRGNTNFGRNPVFLAGGSFGEVDLFRMIMSELGKTKFTDDPTFFNVEVFSHHMERSMPPFAACKLLSPPYLSESPWHHDAPFRSILLWNLSTDSSNLLALRDAHAAAPWCTLVIRSPESNAGMDLEGLYDILSQVVCLPVALRPGMSPLSAIRNRRAPSITEILRYIQARPGQDSLARQLRLLFGEHATELSRRSVRENLKRTRHLTPRHWEWAIELAQIRTRADESAEGLAGRCAMDVRAMRHHVRTCLGVSLDEFRQLVGWEWRIEAALRVDKSSGLTRGGAIGACQ